MAKKLEKVTTLKTLDDVNIKLAELKLTNARIKEVEAELNVKRTEIENKYTPDLTALREQKLLIETDIELWANVNKGNLENKRSWDMLHGTIGFRQSTKLGTLKKLKWNDVLDKLKALGGRFKTYIRVKEEVAKDELKNDIVDGNITLDDAVTKIGVCLETVDNFFIDTNAIDVDKAA